MPLPPVPPTKYNQELVERVHDYVKNYAKLGDKVPSIEGLAVEINIAVSTLHKWDKEPGKEALSEALNLLRAKQARSCINNGLDGTFNSAITKLILHNHGYSDKTDATNKITGDPNEPLEVRVADRAIIDQALNRLGAKKDD